MRRQFLRILSIFSASGRAGARTTGLACRHGAAQAAETAGGKAAASLALHRAGAHYARGAGFALPASTAGAAGLVAAAGLLASATTTSQCASRDLDPDTVRELAEDLGGGSLPDRERAVAVLSGLTLYLEHHAALLMAGVLEPAMGVVKDGVLPAKLRSLALQCCADLLKDEGARKQAVADKEFMEVVVAVLRGDSEDGIGTDGDDVSRANAARALAELSAQPDLHGVLAGPCGAAEVLAAVGAELAEESAVKGKTYESYGAVPGNVNERNLVEEERFVAAALFALAAGDKGRPLLAQKGGQVLHGFALWAASYDPVLRRYGVGGLARFASSGPKEVQQLVSTPGAVQGGGSGGGGRGGSAFDCLVRGLNMDDPQAQCYAAGAVGKIAAMGAGPSSQLIAAGAPGRLLDMIKQEGGAGKAAGAAASPGVRRGVYKCALRAVEACSSADQGMRKAMQEAGAAQVVEEALASGRLDSDDLKVLAAQAAAAIKSRA